MGMRLTHKWMPLVSCPDPSRGGVWARNYYLTIYPRVTWVASCRLKNPNLLVAGYICAIARSNKMANSRQHLFCPAHQLLVNTALILVDPWGVLCGASSNMTRQLRRAFVRWGFLIMWFVPTTFPGNIPQTWSNIILKTSHPEAHSQVLQVELEHKYYRLCCQLRNPKMRWRQGDAPFPQGSCYN